MISATLPDNEEYRQADLQALRVLDTPPEHRFDRLVNLASDLFNAPIAYIALIDSDRQWFKAKCGLTVDQTGREVSFCGHAILQDTPLLIPDATEDERFRDNPLVVGEPHLRFYLGVRLRGPGGFNVGTFCIADRRRREFSDEQVRLFQRLAEVAEHELNMVGVIHTQRDLLEARNELARTQQKLQNELNEAAEYVAALLPRPMTDGPVRTDFRFLTSSQLGGDLLGYHWLDEERTRLAVYLLDVCGHGVGASLLASSVWQSLRRQTLPDVAFDDPADVLSALNRAFPMDQHNGKFFTVWYGVYHMTSRTLRFATAGHPPAVAFLHGELLNLGRANLVLGVLENPGYQNDSISLPPDSRVYLFSDGVYEAKDPQGKAFGRGRLQNVLAEAQQLHAEQSRAEFVIQALRTWKQNRDFEDDVSLLELHLPD
jgi:phosphoserine phosphatase RsbU/P